MFSFYKNIQVLNLFQSRSFVTLCLFPFHNPFPFFKLGFSIMPCKTFLRHDQSINQAESCQSKDVVVYAPTWVQQGLSLLGKRLKGIEFQLCDKPSLKRGRNSDEPEAPKVLDSFKISEDFNGGDLVLLQRIARNESRNTNGVINTSYYSPEIQDANLIYSIKDLARQSVIVGKDLTTHFGGYKSTRVAQNEETVYICDLAALQFQKPYNSGRLILIQEDDPHKGPLDDFIFERVVGEKKQIYRELIRRQSEDDIKSRYVKHDGFGKAGKGTCFFDKTAYKKFVELDVTLSGLAVAELATKQNHKVNFKFLKYGTGYFAGKFKDLLEKLILSGVVDGLERLLKLGDKNVVEVIKVVEFPFYSSNDPENTKRLDELKRRFNVEYKFSRDDALKQTMKGKNVVTATTNCADTNVACGNAMGFKSADGAIAENLLSKGNIFCPNLNKLIEYKYLNV